MKNSFLIGQKDLLATLFFMQPICTKKTTINATSYILFSIVHKELTLKATDLEISLQYSCPLVESSVQQAQFLVPGKKIFDLVKEMDGDIECFFSDSQITLESKKHISVTFNIKNAQDFPPLPERIENLMHVDAQFFSNLLSKVSFLIPQNNTTAALNGLLLEITATGLTLTSTDGHCLAQIKSDKYVLDKNYKWLIPRRAIFELKKILENAQSSMIFLGICEQQLVFSGDSFNFFTRLLVDEFPKYESIVKYDSFVPATMSKSDFVKTLRRSSCLLSGQFLATHFVFNKDFLKVFMKNNDIGNLEETLPVKQFQADQLEMKFYSPYLLQGLQSFDDDVLTCFLKSNTRPIIFTSSQELYTLMYLVMPVSTSNA